MRWFLIMLLGCGQAGNPEVVELLQMTEAAELPVYGEPWDYEVWRVVVQRGMDAARHQELVWWRKQTMIEQMLLEEIGLPSEVKPGVLRGLRASHVVVVAESGESIAREIASRLGEEVDGLDLVELQSTFEVPDGVRLHVDLHMTYPAPGQGVERLPAGWVELHPAFVEHTSRHGVGVVPPFETSFGWHVVVVHEVLEMEWGTQPEGLEAQALEFEKLLSGARRGAHFNTYPRVIRERFEDQ